MLECELIRRLIISYFSIVRESIQDQVPKAVMHLLVNFCKESAQTRLVSKLYKESLLKSCCTKTSNWHKKERNAKTYCILIKKQLKLLGKLYKTNFKKST